MVALTAGMLTACGGDPSEGPVVLVIEDPSFPDAREVVTPGVLGLETGLDGAPLRLRVMGTDDVDVAAIVADPAVVAVVIAPFTRAPAEVVEGFGDAGIASVSLSDLDPGGATLPFVAPLDAHANAVRVHVGDGTLCAAGASTSWGRTFVDALTPDAELQGRPVAIATEAGERDCDVLVWAGDAREAATLGGLLPKAAPGTSLIVGSAARTPGFAADTPLGVSAAGTCACVDLSTSADPEAQAFLHAYASAHGLDAGPFAVEGYDAGRLLAIASTRAPTREAIAAALAGIGRHEGLAGSYAWDSQGDLRSPRVRMYERVGLRWLELSPTRVAPEATRE